MRRALAAIASLLCAAASTHAQNATRSIVGVVRDSASGQPLPGVVVLTLNAADSNLTRATTSADGRYRISAPLEAQRLELRRIGFRPRIIPLSQGDNAATVDASLSMLPSLLEPAMVHASARCPHRSDNAAALGLWEQARTALLSAVIARETSPPSVIRLRFDRTLEDKRATQQVVFIDSSSSTVRPFPAAHTGSEFATRGFLEVREDGRSTFFAPDADALLEESFARDYCFRIAPRSRERPNDVGLALSPAERRAGRVDIDGVLWIDTLHRELRNLEFEYVSRDATPRGVRRGGRIDFYTLANGTLFDRWTLQLPRLRIVDEKRGDRIITRKWFEAHEVGGEVARARWPDGFAWGAPLGTLHLRARSASSPADHVRIRLRETNYEAITDQTGAAEVANLLPGPYAVDVVDSALARIDLTLPTALHFDAVADSVTTVTLDLPTRANFVADECARDHQRIDGTLDDAALLVARIIAPDGGSVDGVQWSISRRIGAETREIARGRSGPTGLIYRCNGLVRGESTELRVWRSDKPNAPLVARFAPADIVTVLRLDLNER